MDWLIFCVTGVTVTYSTVRSISSGTQYFSEQIVRIYYQVLIIGFYLIKGYFNATCVR